MGLPDVTFYQFVAIILPGFYIITMLIIGAAVFFNIPLDSSLNQAILAPLYIISGLIVGILLDSVDLINWTSERIHRLLPEIKFFRGQYPSYFLIERCEQKLASGECEPDCINRLRGPEEDKNFTFLRVWFYIFDNLFPGYLRTFVLTQGHTCRAVLYIKVLSWIFAILGLLLLFMQCAIDLALFWFWQILAWFVNVDRVPEKDLSQLGMKSLFIIASLFIGLLFHHFNSAKEVDGQWKTKGVWSKWKNICADQRFWLRLNDDLLEEIICKGKAPKSQLSEPSR